MCGTVRGGGKAAVAQKKANRMTGTNRDAKREKMKIAGEKLRQAREDALDMIESGIKTRIEAASRNTAVSVEEFLENDD